MLTILLPGPNGEIGAAKLTQEVLTIMNSLPNVVLQMTGIDLNQVSLRLPVSNGCLAVVLAAPLLTIT
jgi:hypothetical protein